MQELTTFPRRSERAGGTAKADSPRWTRRRMLGLAAVCLGASMLAGCNESKFHSIDISGELPSLAFTMTRAADHKEVTQADYRGQVVLLYFGYTFCPDICPTTLTNVHDVLRDLGPDAKHVRVLFVTVDPNRDTLPILADYVKNFGSHMEGLRATPDELATLARRYRFVYSVKPAAKDHPYEVTHNSTIYVFDGTGTARLLVSSLATAKPDIKGTTADLKRLVEESHPPGLLERLENIV